jgi:hypothetical protein
VSFLTGLDWAAQDVALTGLGKVCVAQRTGVVNVEHVVSANVSDTASGRPSIWSWVTKSPGLGERGTYRNPGTINDGITDEVSVKSLCSGFRSANWDSFGLDWLLLGRDDNLLLDWLNGVYKEITDGDLLLLSLGLLGLHVNNSLDLGCSIGRGSASGGLGGGRAPGSQAIAKPGKQPALLIVVHSRHADTAHRCLELDERVSVVVLVARVSLAVLAEVGVVTDGTLVADTFNVRQVLLVFAKRPVTVNTIVAVAAVHRLRQRLVDGNKAVAGMDELGVLHTLTAVIPIRAVQTLVADTVDELVTAITDS